MRLIQRVAANLGRLSCVALVAAQFQATAIPVLPGQKSEAQAESRTIRVDVTLVTVPVIVADKGGNYVPDLKESDFHIFENGVQQKIDRLIPSTDPFNVALMLDSSGSTHFKFEEIQNAALTFVEALRPQDRVLIVSFDSEVTFHGEPTDDRVQLRRAILQTGSTAGNTRLYDALERVVTERFNQVPGRKAIVLFTDGVDNGSRLSDSAATLGKIEKSDVLVYALQYDTRKDGLSRRFPAIVPPGYESFGRMYARAVSYLRDLSGHSGGRVYHAETIASLNEAFALIAAELPRQYTLCYYPANQKHDGSFRRIRVSVDRPGVQVRARTGYRAGTQLPKGK